MEEKDLAFIYKLMEEHMKMKQALEKIYDYDPDFESGYTDEWSEALGFTFCQETAKAVLKEMGVL